VTKLLSRLTDQTQIYDDQENLTIIDHDACYLYHKYCGGLLMAHPLAPPETAMVFREMHEVARSTIRSCQCFSKPQKDNTQQLLANIYVSLGACKTIEDARIMIKEFASQEEMREGERQRL
jgi:hypothetical protein